MLHIDYPMLFQVENRSTAKSTHCGVLEFIADEGMVFMPYWMMQNLLLSEGDMVSFKNATLPKGKYVKLQPHTKDFLDISNPKAVLERTLRNYACLSVGDSILVHYNNKNYFIDIVEAKPQEAVSIVETDCEVDFAPPLDYVEPEPEPLVPTAPVARAQDKGKGAAAAEEEQEKAAAAAANTFMAFSGSGKRLDGKEVSPTAPVPIPRIPSGSGSIPRTPSNASVASSSGSQPPPADGEPGQSANGAGRPLAGKLVFGSQLGAPKPGLPKGNKKTEDTQPEPSKESASSFAAFSGKSYKLK